MFFSKNDRLLSLLLTAALLFLILLPVYGSQSGKVYSAAAQTSGSGMGWVTRPLEQLFIQVQYKFIGVVPGNYTEPTDTEYSMMRRIFSLIDGGVSGNSSDSIMAASSLASQIDYQLLSVRDSSTGNRFYVLLESQSVNRGWGTYFFAAGQGLLPSPRVIIEAPHPVTDFNSQNIAYEIFTGSYPHVFGYFLSGVERTFGPKGQTDMAHRSLSIFETATEAFARLGSIVIQIHSFDAGRHPGYPLVVLSSGDGGTNGALESIASNLHSSGISVGIFDGFRYEALSATGNIQGRHVRAIGGGFVHAEISSTVVFNSTLISTLQSSFSQSVTDGFKYPAYQIDLRIPAITFSVAIVLFLTRFRFSKSRFNS
jgi:hypothetical protein